MAGAWIAERRAAQAARARALKPWTKSTGPKTAAGKAKVAGNALRAGMYTREFRGVVREARAVLRHGRHLLAQYGALCGQEAKAAQIAAKSENKLKPPGEDHDASDHKTMERQHPDEENLENKLKRTQDRGRPGRGPMEHRQKVENKVKSAAAGHSLRNAMQLDSPRRQRRSQLTIFENKLRRSAFNLSEPSSSL